MEEVFKYKYQGDRHDATSIIAPDGVTAIVASAFYDCNSLTV